MARDFPGNTSNYLSIGDLAQFEFPGSRLISVSAWVRRPTAASNYYAVSKFEVAAASQEYALYVNSSLQATFVTSNGAGSLSLVAESGVLVKANTWTHICGVQNNTENRCYVNGQSTVSDPTPQILAGTTAPLQIGLSQTTEVWQGQIAEVAIWNFALSSAEITSLASGGCPMNVQWPSLAGYWPLKGITSPEPDRGRNNKSASITGTVPGWSHPGAGCEDGTMRAGVAIAATRTSW